MLGQTGGKFHRSAGVIPVKLIDDDICGRWLALGRYAECRHADGTEPKMPYAAHFDYQDLVWREIRLGPDKSGPIG